MCGATRQQSLLTGTEEGRSSSRSVWARQPDIAFKTKVKENLFGASKLTHLVKAPAASLMTQVQPQNPEGETRAGETAPPEDTIPSSGPFSLLGNYMHVVHGHTCGQSTKHKMCVCVGGVNDGR